MVQPTFMPGCTVIDQLMIAQQISDAQNPEYSAAWRSQYISVTPVKPYRRRSDRAPFCHRMRCRYRSRNVGITSVTVTHPGPGRQRSPRVFRASVISLSSVIDWLL